MAAVVGNLDTLVELSNTLDQQLGKTPPKSMPAPKHELLHPDLVEVLSVPLSVWRSQGIAVNKVQKFTDKAKGRGFRKSALIFGWHPEGHTYWAVPTYYGDECVIYRFDRHNGLAQTELDLEGFIDALIEETKATNDKLEDNRHLKQAARPVEERPEEGEKKKMRTVRVRLPETNGAVLRAGSLEDEFDDEEFGYLIWSLEALQMLDHDEAPDLSAWSHRALRRVRLEDAPEPGDDKYEEYRKTWLRISRRDRVAEPTEMGRIAGYKFTEPGEWILGPGERETLVLNKMAKAPRHIPDDEQAAIWKRFTDLCEAGEVEIDVR